jgi:hydrogenase maturation protease
MSCVSDRVRRLVVGVGNPDRGDDGVGLLVARMLRDRLPADVRIEERLGGAAELIELLREADQAVLVDAMVSGAPAGTIRRFDCAAGDAAPGHGQASSHGLGVTEAVGLASALSCLPRVCLVYGVEAAEFSPGSDMSDAVVAGAEALADRLAAEWG